MTQLKDARHKYTNPEHNPRTQKPEHRTQHKNNTTSDSKSTIFSCIEHLGLGYDEYSTTYGDRLTTQIHTLSLGKAVPLGQTPLTTSVTIEVQGAVEQQDEDRRIATRAA